MTVPPTSLSIADYVPEHRDELVRMWRASFEQAVGIVDPHPITEQIEYFESTVLPSNRVRVVLETGDHVIGFMASSPQIIAQLYVDVAHQRRGIGASLLELAKIESTGRLRLFTFARNHTAQAFYCKHGFREIARGFEPEWGLEDVQYEWERR